MSAAAERVPQSLDVHAIVNDDEIKAFQARREEETTTDGSQSGEASGSDADQCSSTDEDTKRERASLTCAAAPRRGVPRMPSQAKGERSGRRREREPG